MPWNRVLAAGGAAGLAALAGRYAAGLVRSDRSWPAGVEARLSGLGEVDEMSILPLVERLTPSPQERWSPPRCRRMCLPACTTRAPISRSPLPPG